MNKSLIALATAGVAIAATISQAEAGFRIGIGFGLPIGVGAFHNYGSYEAPRRIYRERVQERAPICARKVQKEEVAKDDDAKSVAQHENSSIAVAAANVATPENSSITVASVDDAKKVEPVKITDTQTAEAAKVIEPVKTETKKSEPAVAQKFDCKKFFPSVGLTLTVPCE
jgi:hypothetical protein